MKRYGFLLAGAVALGGAHLIRFGGAGLLTGLILGVCVATIAYACVYVPLGFLTDRAVIVGVTYLLIFENGAAFLLTGPHGAWAYQCSPMPPQASSPSWTSRPPP